MTGKTAAEKLQDLYALGPKADDYKKSRNIGSRKNPQIIQELNSSAYEAAQQRFLADHADEITGLRAQMGQETAKGGLETEAATQRAGYLKGPIHAMFSDYAAAPPFLGALTGYGLARATTPRALPGATKLGRLGTMTGPLAEAALGPIVDAIAHRAQGDNPTARGQDVTSAVGNFGLGEAAGALTGGVYQAYGSSGQNVPGSVPPPSELPPEAPPPQPIGKSGDPHTSAVNEIARRLDLPVEKAKRDTYAPIEPALRKADERQIRRIAEDIHAYDPAALEGVAPSASLGKVRTAVVNFARKVGTKGATLAGLGLLGGLAAEAWPTRAEAAKPTDFPTRAEVAAGLSRGWEAAKALPGQLVRGVPENFLKNTPGIQGGDLGLSPEEFQLSEDAKAAHAANLAAAKEARYQKYRASIPPRDPGEVPEALRHYIEAGPRPAKGSEHPPIKEEEMFPGMAQKPPAEPYASGGKVSPPAHARAMNAKLSAMQHELQRALSVAVKRLEGLDGKKGAKRAAGKVHQEKEDLIEDIWGLHELAQKIVGGKLSIHPQISKKELIGLAREHASSSSSSS
jgi:hypothetical protein